MNNDIGYTVIDMMLKLFIFAGISAALLLAGVMIYAVWIWRRRK